MIYTESYIYIQKVVGMGISEASSPYLSCLPVSPPPHRGFILGRGVANRIYVTSDPIYSSTDLDKPKGVLYVHCQKMRNYMDVSKNSGTPKSSILIGFSIINHPFWSTSIFGNTHMVSKIKMNNVKHPTLCANDVALEINTKSFGSRGIGLIFSLSTSL